MGKKIKMYDCVTKKVKVVDEENIGYFDSKSMAEFISKHAHPVSSLSEKVRKEMGIPNQGELERLFSEVG